ncbi:MAG: hypothetical protein WBD28_06735, partial [Candidatus Zixiibacteriota bacterium]
MNNKTLLGFSISLLCFCLLFLGGKVESRNAQKEYAPRGATWTRFKPTQDLPKAQQRVHRVGNAYFCVTNWGFFG